MSGLTNFGIVHTVISLVAVSAGLVSFAKSRAILPRTPVGQVYIWMTVLTCLTGFGLFQHGGFGKAHVLGIVTLVTLAIAWATGRNESSSIWAKYVETACYTATFLFHMIPAVTETFTRLPSASPVFASADDSALGKVTAALICAYLVVAALQIRTLRSKASRSFQMSRI